MVILRLNSQNRMVTKGYQEGVYEWVEGRLLKPGCSQNFWHKYRGIAKSLRRRAASANTNIGPINNRGFGPYAEFSTLRNSYGDPLDNELAGRGGRPEVVLKRKSLYKPQPLD